MKNRVTILLPRSQDAHMVFEWIRDNTLEDSWYVGLDWVDVKPYITQVIVRTRKPFRLHGVAAIDIFTDEDRNRILTFEFRDDGDATLFRLRFNEVPLERNYKLHQRMLTDILETI